jgi:hypothetical protein
MKGMARISARTPRHLSGLADAKVEQHCHRYGALIAWVASSQMAARRDGRNENDSSVGSALNVPLDSVIGVVKIAPSVAGSGGSLLKDRQAHVGHQHGPLVWLCEKGPALLAGPRG